MGNFAQAEAHYERSLAIDTDQEHTWGVACSLGEMANMYETLGALDKAEAYRDFAEQQHLRSVEISSAANDSYELAYSLKALASFCRRRRAYEKATARLERLLVVETQRGIQLDS